MKKAFKILFELLAVVAKLWWFGLSFHKSKYEGRVNILKSRAEVLVKDFGVLSDQLDKEHQEEVERYRKVKAEIDKLNRKGK